MTLEIDSNLHYRVQEEGCTPIVFIPDVDLFNLAEESITQAF